MTNLQLFQFFLTLSLWPVVSTILVALISFFIAKKLLRNESSKKYIYIAPLVILIIGVIYWWPKFVPGNPKLFGPGGGPSITFSNILEFLKKAPHMETVTDIAKNPNDIPSPIARTSPDHVKINLTAKEVFGQMANGVKFNYWTYNGTVPGPFLRIKEGDTVDLTITNDPSSVHPHDIDLHAVTGPGGGAVVSKVMPGETKSFTFKALNPGLYVYHCAYQNASTHMAHGMYGLILVEPKQPLPPVDHEFYVMQGEFYSARQFGSSGLQTFDHNKMLNAEPEYIVFNGRTGGVNNQMKAKVGDKIRIYFGNGGVNLVSSFHVIGEIFDTVYPEGAMGAGSHTQANIQTTVVPAGGATAVEFTVNVPGKYMLVDHALARLDRGAWGTLEVTGEPNQEIYDGVVSSHADGH